jgi:hypothetical protein
MMAGHLYFIGFFPEKRTSVKIKYIIHICYYEILLFLAVRKITPYYKCRTFYGKCETSNCSLRFPVTNENVMLKVSN